ncbi:MAG: hypothetical protein A2312_00450 [Candidatus Staskawiczbacteria bacterium RIFOXYB2_FULL_32_9]|uniref:Endolytic murein transglycosylase n=1 Tax=Candidatus Staskawiczbacteria bacterium RIFOXYD1_FULL_32_13 TaxID=1802234 RepID=A0A1G2JN92_9BACT|nr:MAG: Aminodeoxychorismate lyase [Parcubacteria group bacterium GW2011_GWC2_32_10]OGZ77575.1 MAG: hypothetical protein A2256_02330 [Candidatus Staskawiczbacteria bacterium RIFOXYA2_FULL_32_7]OGZ78276.1 MAG: hypothetical protein A2360_03865 [Candidatus Staskawiczbacteria bacterium RIFOXYB1_FULL_32_11]OGZ84562.1 MAG: hypothetical protein A2312_00450 [Candidatus Staskawiczbacteria bacterium RIFOXYB2_FULL_32_9]OGZ87255.1 MAG: hypothetical protein A2463_02750 [Candidatus Staskawiczbacteria bacteri
MNKISKIFYGLLFVIFFAVILFWYEIYIPNDLFTGKIINYKAERGLGDDEIAVELQKQDIIKSNLFFRFYVIFSGNHGKIQAGNYVLGSNMSVAQIVEKFVLGDVIKDEITIIEGWNLNDIQNYLFEKKVCNKEDFLEIVARDFSNEFIFLEDKPKNVDLEGYIFPDTYEILTGESCEQIIKKTLVNFGKKLDYKLQEEIIKQKRNIFDVVVLASIIEKEVITIEDKKIVAGILNNRLESGMPLQVDSTINYITGKNHPGALIIDTKIDSPYNTYKYAGLPLGPISNPGLDSIKAVIYPTESNYFYYLSTKDGKTIFSKTLDEHNIARAKYLR